jgi:hypothetical protein
MIKKITLSTFLTLAIFTAFAQQHLDYDKEIKLLNSLGKSMLSAENDSSKYKINTQFKSLLKEVIVNKISFTYNFDALKTISIQQAGELKIYNWALPKTNGTFDYFAFVTLNQKNNDYKVIELTDESENIKSPENKTLMPKMWYGALYYKLIHNKKTGSDYYTLLGWDGNNNLTTKKIIDVIQVYKNGSVKIGAPIFKMKKKTQRRLIFEYSNNVVMSLKYDQKSEKIIFDNLIPSSSKLKGIYEYYGPELNIFNALKAEKGKWIYEEDTEVGLDKSVKDFMWKDPKKE